MDLYIIFGTYGIDMTDWPSPAFDNSDWLLIEQERVASGFFQLDSLTLSHRGYKADIVGPMQRELLVKASAVVVILCDLMRQQVIMVEQFRIGAAMSELGGSPSMLEWVAGICDLNEDPLATCNREVFEETGLKLTDTPEHLFTYYPSPGGSNELIHLFFSSCDATLIGKFQGQKGEYEDLKVHAISFGAAFKALRTGRVNNAATIIGLQWLQANSSRLLKGV